MSGTSAKSTSKRKWSSRIIGYARIILALAAILLIFRYCTERQRNPSGTTTNTQAVSTSAVSSSKNPVSVSTVSTVTSYQVEIPKGGTVHVPEQNTAGTYSTPVHIPSGFTTCRDADRGKGSYLTQIRNQSKSDEWQDLVAGATANEERYQSIGAAQDLRFRFVPESSHC